VRRRCAAARPCCAASVGESTATALAEQHAALAWRARPTDEAARRDVGRDEDGAAGARRERAEDGDALRLALLAVEGGERRAGPRAAERLEEEPRLRARAHEHERLARDVRADERVEEIELVLEGADDEALRESLETSLTFIEETGVDVFAPSIGNAHGSYKTTPVIDFDRVSDIVTRKPIPIALHGGSGLTDEQFAELIARGCAKVNISTALKELYMKSTLAYLVETEKKNKWDPPSLFRDTRAAVVAMVVDLAEQFGSAGKAA